MHSTNLDADVIVVGLGPTGATAASLLGRRGLRVIALDKSDAPFPKPRAIGFDHEVMRVMQELGIAERVAPLTTPYRPSEYRGIDGRTIRRIEASPPPNILGWDSNYVFDQPGFERELRRGISECPEVEAKYSHEVTKVAQDADHVWAEVRTPDGNVRQFTARYLLACDGGSSPIRKALGITLTDLGFDEPWLVVDAIVPDSKLKELPDTQVQYCDPARPSTFVVGTGNHRRWEIMLQPGDSVSADFPDAELWPLLSRWLKPGEATIWRSAAYRFRSLIANEWRDQRIFLCGDTAHMTPPFMSQGLVQGIRDALNLSWKLQRVLTGNSPDALLDTYGPERRPHVEGTTWAAIRLGREICERDPQKARERDERLLASSVNGRVAPTIRQNLIPGLLPGQLITGTPGAGSLAPQPYVASDGMPASRLLDDVTGRTFRVLISGALPEPSLQLLKEAVSSLDGSVSTILPAATAVSDPEALVEHTAVFTNWMSAIGKRIAIVRPDHYVYATAATVEEALAQMEMLGNLLRSIRKDSWPRETSEQKESKFSGQ